MLNIIENEYIRFSVNDTFLMTVTNGDDTPFTDGAHLRFIIAKSEQSETLIDKMYSLDENGVFKLSLTEQDKKKIPIGLYVYKIMIHSGGQVITMQSGYFEVIWGE